MSQSNNYEQPALLMYIVLSGAFKLWTYRSLRSRDSLALLPPLNDDSFRLGTLHLFQGVLLLDLNRKSFFPSARLVSACACKRLSIDRINTSLILPFVIQYQYHVPSRTYFFGFAKLFKDL